MVFGFSSYRPTSELVTYLFERVFQNGDLGVNFFFVLSGFLITFLLLKEKHEKRSISIPRFYLRRILRIWPVYFLTIVMGFFLIPYVFKTGNPAYFPFMINIPTDKLPWYLCFAVNFDMVIHGISYLVVVILWSVSVEEQFYLVWPLLNKFSSRFFLTLCIVVLILLSFYYRFLNYQLSINVKYSTFSVMSDLSVGSLFAVLSFYSETFKGFFIELKRPLIGCLYVLLVARIGLRGFMFNFTENTIRLLISIEPLVFSLLFGVIIMEQDFSRNSLFKISKLKFLTSLGRISYGLYCYHMFWLFIFSFIFRTLFRSELETNFALFIFQALITLTVTIIFSRLSYRFFETGFLKLKDRFSA